MGNTQGARDQVLSWNHPHFSCGDFSPLCVFKCPHSSWGDGNEKRDWAMAAKKAGDLVLEVQLQNISTGRTLREFFCWQFGKTTMHAHFRNFTGLKNILTFSVGESWSVGCCRGFGVCRKSGGRTSTSNSSQQASSSFTVAGEEGMR